MKLQFDNDVPRPTEAVLAPWTVPQMSAIIAWVEQCHIRAPICPRHGDCKPKLAVRFDGFSCEEPGCTFQQTWATPDAFRCHVCETKAEMQERVDDWNDDCPDGTAVDYDPDGPELKIKRTHTRSRAFIHPTIGPAVHLYGLEGAVALECVTECPQRKSKSPQQIAQECLRILMKAD